MRLKDKVAFVKWWRAEDGWNGEPLLFGQVGFHTFAEEGIVLNEGKF